MVFLWPCKVCAFFSVFFCDQIFVLRSKLIYIYIYNRNIEDGNNKKTVSEKDNQRMFIEGRSTHCLGM